MIELTQEQMSAFISEKTATVEGLQDLITVLFNSLMLHERSVWQAEEGHESADGFRQRRIRNGGFEFLLKVPRTCEGGFYPFLLAILRNENEERDRLVSELYLSGLTTEQIGKIIGRFYSQTYSKQHISYLVRHTIRNVTACRI